MTALAEADATTAAERVFAAVATRPARSARPRSVRVAPPGATPVAAAPVAVTLAPGAPAAGAPEAVWPMPAAARPTAPVVAVSTPAAPATPAPVPAPAPAPAPARPAGSSSAPLPRLRLTPAPPAARAPRATTPVPGRPPTLDERVLVLRADDRSLVLEASDSACAPEEPDAVPADDPALVVRRLATASVEVIGGSRPAAQLARWLSPGVLDALRARAVLSRRASLRLCRAPACRSVRVCLVDERVVEATVVVDDGHRVRAVAVRLEPHRGAWRATALEVG